MVNTHQRPKVDPYQEHLFIVARMATLGERLLTEQASIFLGSNYVLTFVEDPGDSFDPVRARIRGGHSKIRQSGPAYLAYSLLDAIVDSYFPVIEAYGDRLDSLEDEVSLRGDHSVVNKIHHSKQDMRALRRVVWPLREAINALSRDESPLIDPETRVYLRDCYDHLVQIMDLVETYRELGADLTDLYLSMLSNRMNDVMKVLTIISTIFIPLSFVAGIYGMNFNTESPWNMPELNWRYGYPFALGVMGIVAGALVAFFYRKGWLKAMAPGGSQGPLPPNETQQ